MPNGRGQAASGVAVVAAAYHGRWHACGMRYAVEPTRAARVDYEPMPAHASRRTEDRQGHTKRIRRRKPTLPKTQAKVSVPPLKKGTGGIYRLIIRQIPLNPLFQRGSLTFSGPDQFIDSLRGKEATLLVVSSDVM